MKFCPECKRAYEDALEKTSADWAPWYPVPAKSNWFGDVIVSAVIARILEKMDMHYPPVAKGLMSAVIR